MIEFKCPYCDSLQRVTSNQAASHAWCRSCKRIIPVLAENKTAQIFTEPGDASHTHSFSTDSFEIPPPEQVEDLFVPESIREEVSELSWEPANARIHEKDASPVADQAEVEYGPDESLDESFAPFENLITDSTRTSAPVVLGPEDRMPDIEEDILNKPMASTESLESIGIEETWQEVQLGSDIEAINETDDSRHETAPLLTREQLEALTENIESALAMAEQQIEEIREMARTLEAEREALRAELEQALADLAEARAGRKNIPSLHPDEEGGEVSSAIRPEIISEEESKGLSAMLESFIRFTNSD